MRQSALKRNAKYGVALLLTGVVLLLMFLKPGPASAVSLLLDCPASVTSGGTLTCTATLDIENLENIPIESLQFNVTGQATFSATFNPQGTVIGSLPSQITSIALVAAQSTPIISAGGGPGYGYGYAELVKGLGTDLERFGTFTAQSQVRSFGYGYGYGYGYGFVVGQAQQKLKLVYRIAITPTVAGDYTASFKVNTFDSAKLFGPVTDTFTVTAPDEGLTTQPAGAVGGPGVPVQPPAPPPAVPPTVVSEARATVSPIAETRIETPDRQVSLTIPANALPPEVIGQAVEVEVKSLDLATLPAPPANTVFVRGIEINTLVNAQKVTLIFTRTVALRVPVTAADLARAAGDPSKLSVSRYDSVTGVWSSLPTTFQATPAPGVLEASLNTFSLFAVGIFQPVPLPVPPPVVTPVTPVAVLPVTKGPRGDAGAKGAAGDRGPAGAAGDRGPAGPAGVKGERGPAGVVGPAGAAGAKGAAGAPGTAGAGGGVSVLDIIGLILAVVAVVAVGAAVVVRRRRTT